jgi:hypothetical protein
MNNLIIVTDVVDYQIDRYKNYFIVNNGASEELMLLKQRLLSSKCNSYTYIESPNRMKTGKMWQDIMTFLLNNNYDTFSYSNNQICKDEQLLETMQDKKSLVVRDVDGIVFNAVLFKQLMQVPSLFASVSQVFNKHFNIDSDSDIHGFISDIIPILKYTVPNLVCEVS